MNFFFYFVALQRCKLQTYYIHSFKPYNQRSFDKFTKLRTIIK